MNAAENPGVSTEWVITDAKGGEVGEKMCSAECEKIRKGGDETVKRKWSFLDHSYRVLLHSAQTLESRLGDFRLLRDEKYIVKREKKNNTRRNAEKILVARVKRNECHHQPTVNSPIRVVNGVFIPREVNVGLFVVRLFLYLDFFFKFFSLIYDKLLTTLLNVVWLRPRAMVYCNNIFFLFCNRLR